MSLFKIYKLKKTHHKVNDELDEDDLRVIKAKCVLVYLELVLMYVSLIHG